MIIDRALNGWEQRDRGEGGHLHTIYGIACTTLAGQAGRAGCLMGELVGEPVSDDLELSDNAWNPWEGDRHATVKHQLTPVAKEHRVIVTPPQPASGVVFLLILFQHTLTAWLWSYA